MRLSYVALLIPLAACSGAADNGPRSNLTPDQALAARTSCTFKAGTLPGLSLEKAAPLGKDIPIDTVVIIMFENRSFDHMLGNLPNAGQTDVEVAPANAANPSTAGTMVSRFHDTTYCFFDTNHEWTGSHLEWDNGKNDGFVVANERNSGGPPDGTRAMSFYTEADIPYFYGVASTFALADHNFCSLLGPTFPNREYLYAATSYGRTVNQLFQDQRATIFESLSNNNVPWHVYFDGIPGFGVFLLEYTSNLDNTSRISDFMTDAAAGKLAAVTFVDPNLRDEYGGGNDFHPPGDVQIGEQFLQQTLTTLMQSPQWPHMAVFITFDENGGLYDHVPPPQACPPDDIDPMVEPGGTMAKFDRYGFRVPLLVVSPYSKPHSVSHAVYDHTSILRFIEARFKIPALTARDANADPLFDMFDFTSPKLLAPPQLPAQSVDPAKAAACASQYPLKGQGGADMGVPDMAAPVDMTSTD
ncbi:MAG TPA: alkaline phosphatase family protein [Polyangia bacterium]|nr:alkaline phosphatase family protein [Polyangia bacterium]